MALDYNQLNHAVLGSGPMGLLLSSLLCKKIDEVYLWIPDTKLASDLEKSRYAKFLQTPFTLPDNLRVVSNFSEFDRNSWAFHIAVPSRILEETVNNLIDVLIKDQEYLFVLFTKGLLPHKTRRQTGLYLFSSYITTKLQEKAIVNSQVSVVNGPSLLQEIYENQNTFLNIGCKEPKCGEFVADLYRNLNIHTMTTVEVESMEFAGVMKNPIAIAIGIVSALPDCGSNIQGELIQVGFNEMLKFAKTLNLSEEIFLGRSGLSDLITTSVSRKSRNRNYGKKIVGELMVGPAELSLMDRVEIWFKPKSFIEREVEKWVDTVEGAYALGILLELANENGIKLPLYETLFSVLARKSPPQAIASLLTDKKSEFPLEKMVGLKKNRHGFSRWE
jgi:glycerol-3-phosphate dehydrogenase